MECSCLRELMILLVLYGCFAMSVCNGSPERQACGKDTSAYLKCYSCRECYAKPPIYPCKLGHVFCPGCSVARHCPLCGRTFRKNRSLELDTIAQKLLKPCQWGCENWMPAEKVGAHETHCDFKRLSCASLTGCGGCDWGGPRKELTQHLLTKHSPIVSNDFMYNFVIQKFSQVEQFSATRLLTCFHHSFLAKLVYDGARSCFYGGVQCVSGAPQVTKGFRYEFEIGQQSVNDTAHYKLIFSRQVHRVSEDLGDRTASGKCDHFCFNKNIGNFFTDSNDTLTVTVIMKSVQSLATKNDEYQKTYGFAPSQYCQKCVTSCNPVPPI